MGNIVKAEDLKGAYAGVTLHRCSASLGSSSTLKRISTELMKI